MAPQPEIAVDARARGRRVLWPREHGAYVQLAAPVAWAAFEGATTLAFAGWALAAAGAFFGHEAVTVLLGRRGARRRHDEARTAWTHVVVTQAAAIGGLALGWVHAGAAARLAMAISVALAFALAVLVVRGVEKTLAGELLAATAFASLAAPLALAAGVAPTDAVLGAGVWSLCFAMGTLGARSVIERRRHGTAPARVAVAFASVAALGCGALAVGGQIEPRVALAPLPFALVVIVIALSAPSPKAMMRLGVALTLTTCASLVVLLAA